MRFLNMAVSRPLSFQNDKEKANYILFDNLILGM